MFHVFSIQTILFITTTVSLALTVKYMLDNTSFTTPTPQEPMSAAARNTIKTAMANLSHAKIVYRPSSTRGTANHGWLDTKHSFSFASWYDPRYEQFGSLRVLNEDRVAPQQGF